MEGQDGDAPPQSRPQNKRLQQTQAQVDEVVEIMKFNLDKVLERDQKLSNLDDRADALQEGASQFEKSAATLKSKMWWKNMKMMLIIGAIVAIIVIILVGQYVIPKSAASAPEGGGGQEEGGKGDTTGPQEGPKAKAKEGPTDTDKEEPGQGADTDNAPDTDTNPKSSDKGKNDKNGKNEK